MYKVDINPYTLTLSEKNPRDVFTCTWLLLYKTDVPLNHAVMSLHKDKFSFNHSKKLKNKMLTLTYY